MMPRRFANRDALRAHQQTALERLLRTLEGNAFYRPRLTAAGLGPAASLDEFVARMPSTRKSQIADDQRAHPPFGTNLSFARERYVRFHQTSATSGPPIRWLDTSESWQAMLDDWRDVLAAAGVTAGDRLFFAFSFGPFLGFWTAFEAAAQHGCLCLPGGGMSTLARLEAIRENQATIVLGTPTYALRLAEVAASEGIDLAQTSVRRIIVAGEPGGSLPAVRQAIERGWGRATVFDHHGMTEVGPVTYERPEAPGALVVLEGSHLAEIVDPTTGAPAAPGEVGELVLTTLRRLGSPLLRYRTGDLVREDLGAREDRCELTLAGGILGRVDDMVFVRGVNVYPAAVEEAVRAIAEVAEYRAILSTREAMTEMALEIEPVPGRGGPALVERVQARMRSRFNLRVEVSLVAPGALPRHEMKARRWIRR